MGHSGFLHDRPDRGGEAVGTLVSRARRTSGRGSWCRSCRSQTGRADRRRDRRSARRRAEGQVAALNLAREPPAGAGHRPCDRGPVRVTGGLARLHADLAVGDQLQPLVPRRPDEHGGPAARPLPLDRALPALGRRRRHPQRRRRRAPPALGRDALGRGPGSAAGDGRGDDRVEHRLVLRLHGHRRHRPAGRRGRAPGQERDQHGARRRRARHRGDPPPRRERRSRTCSGTSACSRARSSSGIPHRPS